MADTRVDPPTDGWSTEDVVDGAAWVDQVDEGWAEWDGEYEYVRQGRSRLKVALAAVFGLVLVGILVAGGLTLWVVRQINPPGDPGPKRTVTIDKGATTSEIADLLESRDIVTNATVFRWYVSYKKAGPFSPGYYELRERSSMGDVIEVLEDAHDHVRECHVPGGAQRLDRFVRTAPRDRSCFSEEKFLAAAALRGSCVRSTSRPR